MKHSDLVFINYEAPACAQYAGRPIGCQITHLPTGTVARSHTYRGLAYNREVCIKMLEAQFGPLEFARKTPQEELIDAVKNLMDFTQSGKAPMNSPAGHASIPLFYLIKVEKALVEVLKK